VESPPPASPTLQFVEVQVIGPSGTLIAMASNSVAGATVRLPVNALAESGTYRVRVRASASEPTSTGHYLLTVYDSSVVTQPLLLNQGANGDISTPYVVNRWTFAATTNQVVRFDLIGAVASNLRFKLGGPDNWTGFVDLSGNSDPVTLPADGTYVLEAY